MMRLTITFFALTMLSPAAAQTPGPVLLGEFRDWTAATMHMNGKVCIAYSQPRESEPRNLKRDQIVFYITRQSGRTGKTEVSVKLGYVFRNKSMPTVTVGEQTFDMFAREDTAWLVNVEDEARLIEAMRKGQDLVVRGTSRRGTQTTDTFSLAGMSAALDRAIRECR